MAKLVKKFTLEDNNKIWRILIGADDKLILERRNTDAKEVFFATYNLENGMPLWENFQFEEKFWIGIEKVFKNVLYLHGFAKPDMPGHKGIIAFDINAKKILWEKPDGVFAFVLDDKVYCYIDDFEGTKLKPLDYLTGEEAGNIIESYKEIRELQNRAYLTEDYSDYYFPEKFYGDEPQANQIGKAIEEITEGQEVVGNAEIAIKDELLFVAYHLRKAGKEMRNIFNLYDLKKSGIIFEDVLNDSVDLFAPDSFFVYKDFLFLIKEKNKLDVYKIERS